jgi:hypothetical protein
MVTKFKLLVASCKLSYLMKASRSLLVQLKPLIDKEAQESDIHKLLIH